MKVEDLTLDDFLRSVSYDMRTLGWEIFWTREMPDSEDDAFSMREDADLEEGGFINLSNKELMDRDGSTVFFSFPAAKIMRSAKRFTDDGRRDGFLLAVRAKGRMTNALMIADRKGHCTFQLGIFGKRFDFLSRTEAGKWEEKNGGHWLTD